MGGVHFLDDDAFVRAALADVRDLRESCGLTAQSAVLDVGCGPGRLAIGLLLEFDSVRRYVGVDVQERHIRWCAEHLGRPGFQFVLSDAPNERYNPDGEGDFGLAGDREFDVIYAYSVLSHMRSTDVDRYLRYFRRSLADGGRVYLTAFVEDDVDDGVENPPDYGPMTWSAPLHCVRYERRSFEGRIHAAGLSVTSCRSGAATDGQSIYVLSASSTDGRASRELHLLAERELERREAYALRRRLTSTSVELQRVQERLALSEQRSVGLKAKRDERAAVVDDLRLRLRASKRENRRRQRRNEALEQELAQARRTLDRRGVRLALWFSRPVVAIRRRLRAVSGGAGRVSNGTSVRADPTSPIVDEPRAAEPRGAEPRADGSPDPSGTVEPGIGADADRDAGPDPGRHVHASGSDRASGPSVVVYTAVVGGYDVLPDVTGFDGSATFVCFSDVEQTDPRGWEIWPIQYFSDDPKRTALFLKTHPHLYFGDHEISVWIDGSIRLDESPASLVGAVGADLIQIAAFVHPDRDCLFDEAAEVIRLGLDDPDLVRSQAERYERGGVPPAIGLHETGVLIRRHADDAVVRFDADWWAEIEAGSRRDQLSFDYVAWRNDVTIQQLGTDGQTARTFPGLGVRKHLVGRKFRRPRASDEAVARRTEWNLSATNTPLRRVLTGEVAPPEGDVRPGVDPVDIVIPVHNAVDDVDRCVRSVLDNTSAHHRITIVDDGSDEPTREWCRSVRDAHPERVGLIRHESARGFSGATNAGVVAGEAPYVVVLNSDTIVAPRWIEKMSACFGASSSVGAVGPLSNAASWQSVPLVSARDGGLAVNLLPPAVSLAEMNDFLERLSRDVAMPFVPTLNGFCLMIRREVFDRIGLLDEATFPRGYGEEVDFAMRATDAGYVSVVALDTYVFHAKSKSFGTAERDRLKQSAGEALSARYGAQRLARAASSTRQHPALEFVRHASAQLYPALAAGSVRSDPGR